MRVVEHLGGAACRYCRGGLARSVLALKLSDNPMDAFNSQLYTSKTCS